MNQTPEEQIVSLAEFFILIVSSVRFIDWRVNSYTTGEMSGLHYSNQIFQ